MQIARLCVVALIATLLTFAAPTPALAAADGEYIRVMADSGAVYRMVGGAPMYVSTWASVGETTTQPIAADLTPTELASLPPYPADGAIANDGVQTYRWAGGAPIVITNWANVDGVKPSWRIDPRAIAEAGTARWSRLRQQPLDGTLIVGRLAGDPENGAVFVIAGGAPIYVATWAGIGGSRPYTVMDMVAIRNAGNGEAAFNHLNYRPADGTLIHDGTNCYVVNGGAPVANGTGTCGTRVDPQAIANAGQPGKWSHLNAPPPPPPPPPPEPTPTPTPEPTPTPAPAPAPAPVVRTVALTVLKKSKLKIDVGPNSAATDYECAVQVRKRRKWRTVVLVMTTGPRDVKRIDLPRGKYRVLLPAYGDAPPITSRTVKLER